MNTPTQESMQLVRNSLLNTVFEPFLLLRNTIAKLPVDQNTMGVQKSLSYLDDGIIWIKEVILNSPLIITEPKKTGECEEPMQETVVEPENDTMAA